MAGHLDINHASTYELERVLHSRERAQLILNKRELLGDFKSWDDVREKVPGVTDQLIAELREAGATVASERPAAHPQHDSPSRKGSRR